MKNTLHYKGYSGSVSFSEEDGVFHGKVSGIRASIFFEGDSVASLTEDFENAVDEYIAYCEQHTIPPEKPFKGSFNVRIQPDLHRQISEQAMTRGKTLNAFVEEAIQEYLRSE